MRIHIHLFLIFAIKSVQGVIILLIRSLDMSNDTSVTLSPVKFYCCDIMSDFRLNLMSILLNFSLRKHAHARDRKKNCCENENFRWKFFYIFLIFAENIDCGYTLEPPR